jgi:hypothetical protein
MIRCTLSLSCDSPSLTVGFRRAHGRRGGMSMLMIYMRTRFGAVGLLLLAAARFTGVKLAYVKGCTPFLPFYSSR